MYKKIIYSAIIALALIATGCKKSFLDRYPETAISDGEFWKTTSDLRLYANNWYNIFFPRYNGFGTIGIYGLDADEGSDNMIAISYNSAMNGERVVPAAASGTAWAWGNLRNINYFLTNYSKSTEPWDNVKTFVGEALFFRAFNYYGLLKTYGDLPWIGTPMQPSSPELFEARLGRNIIVDSMMSDLDRAVEYLPSSELAPASRINKQIAQLLQARIALFEGSWEKYHENTSFGVPGSNGTAYLQKAAAVSNALISAPGKYALEATPGEMGYWSLFNRTNYSSSTEIMLWRQYDISLSSVGGHRWHRYTYLGAGRGLTKDLVEAYLCTDGNPISTSPLYQGDNTLLNVVANRDPRLAQTMYVNDGRHVLTSNRPNGAANILFTAPAFDQAGENQSATGYQVYKGHNPDFNQQQDFGTTGLILFRFAEAFLINAEANAELGSFTQAIANGTVNLLRSRVGMPAMNVLAFPANPNPEFPALSALINEVRRERRVELACEGYRRDDLQRWAAMGLKITGTKPLGAKKEQWNGVIPASAYDAIPVNDDGYIERFKNASALTTGYKFQVNRDYLAPIATDQIVLNPKINQNPNW